MALIKVKTPAKINLTLEMAGILDGGFHKIKSIMTAINLYDFLTFEIEESKTQKNEIFLSGNNPQIPYNEKNLVYKAIEIFCEKTNIKNKNFKVYIEKHIPVEAGLAGGSTNGAGTLFALNKIFNEPLNEKEINDLCANLGSDLNFCLKGGCCLCEGRGEIITQIAPVDLEVALIKPKTFGISAKEAYTKFDIIENKPKSTNTDKLVELINNSKFDEKLMINHLEMAVINDYPVLKKIKNQTGAMMSGSGPTMFTLTPSVDMGRLDTSDLLIIENLKTISTGVEIV